MTWERDAKTLELPWPFTGREDELELVRRASTAGRPGIVITGPAGCGKTRLVTEAVRGTDCARVAGTPETRRIRLAAFAHLVPETATLHDAFQHLTGVRLLLVDDAHLLDDASAALVHQLAVHGRTRLLVVTTDGAPVPGAISRLWTGELLPRLTLEPLPHEETVHLLAGGAGGAALEPLTVNRLYRLCQGNLRLLRELVDAMRERGLLTRVPESDEWAWRGPVPVTATVRERTAHVLDRSRPDERETLERLAFAEPLPLDLARDRLDLHTLEHLEADALVHIDDQGAVRLAHPLHGPVLRAAAGRLRARRLSRTPDQCGPALDAERAALTRRIERADVREMPAPVGEWLVAEGAPVPAGYAAVRARFARLRGELREAAAWAREGLRDGDDDPSCRLELALATAQSGDTTAAHEILGGRPHGGGAVTRPVTARGDTVGVVPAGIGDAHGAVGVFPGADDTAVEALAGDAYDAVRLGTPQLAEGRLTGVFAAHADALAQGDGAALDRVAEQLEERGFLLFAAEAHAQAVRAHRDPRAARTARTRAVALARRCQGARTPALSGLVLGELTARQRQIVTLAAAGLSNRQIAEKLTLSVRTVGNHLYSAYARLGASDRGALPWLVELPDTQSA
ncbi:DNA-binding response regulator, NarL/FixJ family, contains REC and HTH domains [Streptomyces sp. cf386]|uniref:LuxR family transcriptional regulator AbsR2 n=1 Tax=Streptomyces sp. cf386 TaxID=1761904 RepID=UPI00088D1540|nr:LuxR C-terminal-related transcriptional regulator [Streptomyces sp. cf386]SDM35335.1 DNA-binding response regulator, NarL/FixJ family, contains REC and HTH domains [Streptomyces sp. cf386]